MALFINGTWYNTDAFQESPGGSNQFNESKAKDRNNFPIKKVTGSFSLDYGFGSEYNGTDFFTTPNAKMKFTYTSVAFGELAVLTDMVNSESESIWTEDPNTIFSSSPSGIFCSNADDAPYNTDTGPGSGLIQCYLFIDQGASVTVQSIPVAISGIWTGTINSSSMNFVTGAGSSFSFGGSTITFDPSTGFSGSAVTSQTGDSSSGFIADISITTTYPSPISISISDASFDSSNTNGFGFAVSMTRST